MSIVQECVHLSLSCRLKQELVLIAIDRLRVEINFYLSFQVENQISSYSPDGYMVVFAVDEEESLEQAERILCYLRGASIMQQNAVILVANKTDLVRSRVVSSNSKCLRIDLLLERAKQKFINNFLFELLS